MEEMESTERSPAEEKEGWSPAMVSSPEATMLEDTGIKGETEAEGSSRDGGASPLLEERLKPDGDEMHDGAVEVGEKTVRECLDLMAGAVSIVWPMGLPHHDTVRISVETNIRIIRIVYPEY